jgi:hypothetical protein
MARPRLLLLSTADTDLLTAVRADDRWKVANPARTPAAEVLDLLDGVDGAVVRVFNDRGSCLAGLVLSESVRPGVVQLSTGAWFDPSAPHVATCIHGNPNVLTADVGTSALGQACTAQHAQVKVERCEVPLPPVRAFDPPQLAQG